MNETAPSLPPVRKHTDGSQHSEGSAGPPRGFPLSAQACLVHHSPSPLSPGRTSLRSSTPSLASCRSDTNLVVRSPKLFSCRLGVPGGGGACGPASAIAPARRLPSARPGQAGAAATSASVPGHPAAGASDATSASASRPPRESGVIPLCNHDRKI